MRNKIKQIYKGFPLVDLIPFLEVRVILEQPFTHVRFCSRIFLVAGGIHQWASEVSGHEGTG